MGNATCFVVTCDSRRRVFIIAGFFVVAVGCFYSATLHQHQRRYGFVIGCFLVRIASPPEFPSSEPVPFVFTVDQFAEASRQLEERAAELDSAQQASAQAAEAGAREVAKAKEDLEAKEKEVRRC